MKPTTGAGAQTQAGREVHGFTDLEKALNPEITCGPRLTPCRSNSFALTMAKGLKNGLLSVPTLA